MVGTKKNLLLLCYYYPPIKSIASIRSRNVAVESRRHFAQVHIFTTSNRRLLPTDEYDPAPDVPVVEIPTLDPRTLFPKPALKNQSTTGNRLYTWLNSFPLNALIGLGGAVYTLCAFFYGCYYVRKYRITHLFSSYAPYSDHYTAWLLTLIFPKLQWIADFRDLHIDPVRPEVHGVRLQKWINRRLLARAKLVTTVSDGLAKHLQPYNDRVVVVRNAIPSQRIRVVPKFEKGAQFVISYTGNIYPDRQDPEFLFRTVARLQDNTILLQYAGKDGKIWTELARKYGLEEQTVDLGIVPHKTALQLQYRSEVNLLLSWSNPESYGILTGKFYEYIAARQPILLVIRGSYDPDFEQLFHRYHLGAIFYTTENIDSLAFWIQSLTLAWKSNSLPKITEKTVDAFSWSAQWNRLISCLFED